MFQHVSLYPHPDILLLTLRQSHIIRKNTYPSTTKPYRVKPLAIFFYKVIAHFRGPTSRLKTLEYIPLASCHSFPLHHRHYVILSHYVTTPTIAHPIYTSHAHCVIPSPRLTAVPNPSRPLLVHARPFLPPRHHLHSRGFPLIFGPQTQSHIYNLEKTSKSHIFPFFGHLPNFGDLFWRALPTQRAPGLLPTHTPLSPHARIGDLRLSTRLAFCLGCRREWWHPEKIP